MLRAMTEAPATTHTPETPWADWVGLVARVVLGVVWLWAGGAKILHLEESVQAVRGYQLLPYEVALVVGYALPMVEILLGVLLLLGLLTRWAAAASALLMLGFVIGIGSAWARGLSIDCGCFGGGGAIAAEEAARQYPWEIARDTGLFLLGAWLVWRPRTRFSLDQQLFGMPELAYDHEPADHLGDDHTPVTTTATTKEA